MGWGCPPLLPSSSPSTRGRHGCRHERVGLWQHRAAAWVGLGLGTRGLEPEHQWPVACHRGEGQFCFSSTRTVSCRQRTKLTGAPPPAGLGPQFSLLTSSLQRPPARLRSLDPSLYSSAWPPAFRSHTSPSASLHCDRARTPPPRVSQPAMMSTSRAVKSPACAAWRRQRSADAPNRTATFLIRRFRAAGREPYSEWSRFNLHAGGDSAARGFFQEGLGDRRCFWSPCSSPTVHSTDPRL